MIAVTHVHRACAVNRATGGGADAAGKTESGSDLGVAEAAVPQDEDGRVPREPRQRRPHAAALVGRHDPSAMSGETATP